MQDVTGEFGGTARGPQGFGGDADAGAFLDGDHLVAAVGEGLAQAVIGPGTPGDADGGDATGALVQGKPVEPAACGRVGAQPPGSR
jgi:hypothetical protein